MKKKHITGMLFISAILLGTFVWFIERDSENSHRRKLRIRTLFAINPDTIHLIRTERNGTEIECSKKSGQWRMTHPVDAPVNATIVEKMIGGMAAVEHGTRITADALAERNMTPTDYGFDEPRARITFQSNRGTFTWLIGRDAPLGETLYVMAKGAGDVISAKKTLLNLVPEDPAWIRDRTLFKTKAAAVRGIDLRRAAGFLRLRQDQENSWQMEQPHAGQANLPGINSLIEQILSARIIEFIADEKADLTVYGLQEPTTELTLFTENEQTQTLLIGKAHPDHPETLYAKWTDKERVFTVPEKWASDFELDCNQLRNRQIINEPPNEITTIHITSGEQQIQLVQTNREWIITRPARWSAEPAAVGILLEALSGSSIDSFVDNPDETQRQLIQNNPWTIHIQTGKKEHTLRIAEPSIEHRLIQCDDTPSFYTAPASIFMDAFKKPLFYRNRTVLEIEPTHITALALKTEAGHSRIEKQNGGFTATDRTQKIDRDILMELLIELSALRAERYIAFNPESLTPYGLDNPTARFSISLDRTQALGQVILLGSPSKNGRYAMVQGQDVVFVLPKKTVDTLTQKLTHSIEKEIQETDQP